MNRYAQEIERPFLSKHEIAMLAHIAGTHTVDHGSDHELDDKLIITLIL